MSSLTVNDKGVKFAFLDSGVPSQSGTYTTIIAIHGMGFSSKIFRKVQELARNSNVRFVAVNRRGYTGSTPVSDSESAVLTTGSDDEKATFLNDRGYELATFIDLFIQQNGIPPISDDGKTGGVSLLGWSSGCGFTTATIANIERLSAEGQKRFQSHLRAHVMQEPPSIIFGLPLPPKLWSPHMDTSIPADLQTPFYTRWITSYFDHGDLSTRDVDVLSYIVPSASRAPSIYNMSAQDLAELVEEGPQELPAMFVTMPQANAIYNKACFNSDVKKSVPRMKISLITGDVTCSFSLNALWSIEDDDKKNAGGNVRFEVIPGANHFMQWDMPEVAFKAYVDATFA
ncbi:hypothetical protein A7U60_g7768 [Sanghuangporus baumii]|uniref:AB hydrolase-1 domain-containing protein n=1 Tax=Sanghuangporus baumii TaxID=108892 RepID=A0A9Q5N5I1_SANBA|nr:hypothetical protein A7U60_g7768 [Sanghuangporus baumii]